MQGDQRLLLFINSSLHMHLRNFLKHESEHLPFP